MQVVETVKRGLAAMWNGPFYIGPLARPVSVGDVLMKLLETTWRGGLVLAAAAGVLSVVVVVSEAMQADEANPYDAHTAAAMYESLTLSEQMSGRAVFDRAACPDVAKPLRISLTNGSTENVGLIVYAVDIREAGRSTVLNSQAKTIHGEDQDQLWFSDTIMAPGQTETTCSPMPKLAGRPSGERPLTYTVRISDAQATDLPPLRR